jgi:AraC-like DNA-binding protein
MYREWEFGLGGAVGWTSSPTEKERTERILPDGCIDVIWSDGRLLVAGPDTTARQVTTATGVDYVGVRFPPGQAPPLLGVSAYELRDAQPDINDIWPGRGRRLADRITGSTHREAALVAVMRDEAARLDWRPDPFAREIAGRLRRGEAVEQVAHALGVSPRQLLRRSLSAFGYGPKILARVLRLQRAVALARGGMALAEVAASVGYADQAHLTRDTTALAGVPPTALLSA